MPTFEEVKGEYPVGEGSMRPLPIKNRFKGVETVKIFTKLFKHFDGRTESDFCHF